VKVLTAEKAFLALALYNTVRLSMTLFFPFAISMIGECRASVDRVADFLLLEERDARLITRTFHPKSQEVTALYMWQGCVSGTAWIHLNMRFWIRLWIRIRLDPP
jgi:hypothetical protein